MKMQCVSLTVYERKNVKNLLDGYVILSFFLALSLTVIFLLVLIRYISRHLARDVHKQSSPAVHFPGQQTEEEESDEDSAYGCDFSSDSSDASQIKGDHFDRNTYLSSQTSLQSELLSANIIFEKNEIKDSQPSCLLYDDTLLKPLYDECEDSFASPESLCGVVFTFLHDVRLMRCYVVEYMVKFLLLTKSHMKNQEKLDILFEESRLKSFSEDHTTMSHVISELKKEFNDRDENDIFLKQLFSSLACVQVSIAKAFVSSMQTHLSKKIELILSSFHFSYVVQENVNAYEEHFMKLLESIDTSSNESANIVSKYSTRIAEVLSKVSELITKEKLCHYAATRSELRRLEMDHCKDLRNFLKEMCVNNVDVISYQGFLFELLLKQQEERLEKSSCPNLFCQLETTFQALWKTFLGTVGKIESEMISELRNSNIQVISKCEESMNASESCENKNLPTIYQENLANDRNEIETFLIFIVRIISSHFRLSKENLEFFCYMIPGLSPKQRDSFLEESSNNLTLLVLETLLATSVNFLFLVSKKSEGDKRRNEEIFTDLIKSIKSHDVLKKKALKLGRQPIFVHESAHVGNFCREYIKLIEKVFEKNVKKVFNENMKNLIIDQYRKDKLRYHNNLNTMADINVKREELLQEFEFYKRMIGNKSSEIFLSFPNSLLSTSSNTLSSHYQLSIFSESLDVLKQFPHFYDIHSTCLLSRFTNKLKRYSGGDNTKSKEKPRGNVGKKKRKSRIIATNQ